MTQSERGDLTRTQREDQYYRMLAGLAGTRVLQAALELGLPRLLSKKGALSLDEIISNLALHPKRGAKWVLVLRHVGLLEFAPEQDGQQARYRAGPLMRALFHEDGSMGYFYQDFLRYYRESRHDLGEVLRGKPVPQVPYPPQEFEDAGVLEAWMRETATETIETIERSFSFMDVQCLLDVAGGDGTMAVTLVRRHPQLQVTIFNLPNSAYMARQNIARAGVTDRVSVVQGDFRKDPLPQDSFDLVMFSRVLADWPSDVCLMLLNKARDSLVPGGGVLICEPLADDNPDLTIAWEYSYIPHDDFGVEVYKPLAAYEQLLAQAGFRLVQANRRSQDSIHAVIVAERM